MLRSLGDCADTFHKPGFKMHAKILHHLFGLVGTPIIKAPLWDVSALPATAFPNNAAFVHTHVTKLLSVSFPNMQPAQVEVRAAATAECGGSSSRSCVMYFSQP
jgi:exportin-1